MNATPIVFISFLKLLLHVIYLTAYDLQSLLNLLCNRLRSGVQAVFASLHIVLERINSQNKGNTWKNRKHKLYADGEQFPVMSTQCPRGQVKQHCLQRGSKLLFYYKSTEFEVKNISLRKRWKINIMHVETQLFFILFSIFCSFFWRP